MRTLDLFLLVFWSDQFCDSSFSTMKVQGLVALITGGVSGFGKGFAEALLEKGGRAVSLVDISDGKNVVDEFSNKFGADRVMYHHADVRSDSDMENAFERTVQAYRQLDVVCNNAGIANEIPDWKKVIDINLTAVLRGTFLAKKYMDKKSGGKGGLVINVSSIAGLMYLPHFPVYCAAKHGVIGYSRSLAMPGAASAFSPDNIRINVVCPSFADTPIFETSSPRVPLEKIKAFKNSLPMVPVSDVVAAYMRLVEEDLHGEAIRITREKGIDFHKFKDQPESDLSKIVFHD
ncbi:15-hydroxyprostaglandin dehydrogenase [NAD(+)] [Holothuria leucospilota]|uniref:15-hydroxyprostaglandin dehydrogenase [NAD(+)] n=1 Tax=Holothuria leucospilota TaxID=206669 RepID=A0A9Q1CBC9_HOLLE|nr:15-hydroxyprostaglandin dehydrogenase [NAD(+)] [Holothuria leucospilota]